ncbi:MAG: hypothetical protein ACK5N0_12920 [Synechococcaceae cyanobacterium]
MRRLLPQKVTIDARGPLWDDNIQIWQRFKPLLDPQGSRWTGLNALTSQPCSRPLHLDAEMILLYSNADIQSQFIDSLGLSTKLNEIRAIPYGDQLQLPERFFGSP